MLNWWEEHQIIESLIHCMTRLRFALKDSSLAQKTELEELDVVGVTISSPQCQVIIGADVAKVFQAILDEFPTISSKGGADSSAKSAPKGKLSQRIMSNLSAILAEALPAIIGCGIILGVRAILVSFGVPDDSNIVVLLTTMGAAANYFMPFMLACSTANKVGTNKFMAMGLAGVMMHPNIMNSAGEAPMMLFDTVPISYVNYSGSVLPIIFAVMIMKYVYNFFEEKLPSTVRIVFAPSLTYLIMMPLTLIAIAPLSTYLGNYLGSGIQVLFDAAPWAAGAFIGGTRPLLVLVGMHHAVRPIQAVQMSTYGYNRISPLNYVSTLSQATAAFAATFLTRNKKNKQVAISAAISGYMGITEPALYGVIFKYKAALIGTVLGGAVGGAMAAMMKATSHAMSVPNNFVTMPAFMENGPLSMLLPTVVGITITFCTTIFLGKNVFRLEDDVEFTDGKKEKEKLRGKKGTTSAAAPVSVSSDANIISSPMNGEVCPLEKVSDETFSQKLLGDGIAVIPKDGKVYAPVDGCVEAVVPTNHAVGIMTAEGVNVLLHIGIDTVNLDGKFFTPHCKAGQQVSKGTLLIEFDLNEVIKAGYDPTTMLLLTDLATYKKVNQERLSGSIGMGEKLITLS